MNKTVYLVMQCGYEGCNVNGVFSTEENAELFISKQGKPEYDWEEYHIFPYELDRFISLFNDGYELYDIGMRIDGEIIFDDVCDYFSSLDNIGLVNKFDIDIYEDSLLIRSCLFAKSLDEAIAIVNEKRLKLLGLNKWPSDCEYHRFDFDTLEEKK